MTNGGVQPPAPVDQQDAAPVARIHHVSKRFGGTLALDDVSFDIARGRVHALLGGNGSGKSTLIKILAGVFHGERGGSIEVGGQTVHVESVNPSLARSLGFRFVHQHPAVFGDLTVSENLAIGHGYPTGPLARIRWRDLRTRTDELMAKYHVNASSRSLVGDLRPADRTMVAIARALQGHDEFSEAILVLDEPTSALPDEEVRLLMDNIRRLSAAGQTIIYVSHRLDEIIEIADDVTVLRDGRHVVTRPAAGLDEAQLIELIAGRSVETMFPPTHDVEAGDRALEVSGLAGGPLVDVSFAVERGEVLGIAGLLGSGRTELLMTLFGALPRAAGQVLLDGKPADFDHPADAIAAGVAYVPEDRAGQAAFPDLSVANNYCAASIRRYFRFPWIRRDRERADTTSAIDRFRIRSAGDLVPISTLSGGNQQKVIVGRWFATEPRVLLLDEPTQGVDVGARADIYSFVREVVAGGVSVVLVTSDFEELIRVADRIIVLCDGRVSGELRGTEMTAARCTELSYRVREGIS